MSQPAIPDPPFDESLLTAYLDNEVTESERQLVESELKRSASLRDLLQELREVRELVGGLPAESFRPITSGPWGGSDTVQRSAIATRIPSLDDGASLHPPSNRTPWRVLFPALLSLAAILLITFSLSFLRIGQSPWNDAVSVAVKQEGSTAKVQNPASSSAGSASESYSLERASGNVASGNELESTRTKMRTDASDLDFVMPTPQAAPASIPPPAAPAIALADSNVGKSLETQVLAMQEDKASSAAALPPGAMGRGSSASDPASLASNAPVAKSPPAPSNMRGMGGSVSSSRSEIPKTDSPVEVEQGIRVTNGEQTRFYRFEDLLTKIPTSDQNVPLPKQNIESVRGLERDDWFFFADPELYAQEGIRRNTSDQALANSQAGLPGASPADEALRIHWKETYLELEVPASSWAKTSSKMRQAGLPVPESAPESGVVNLLVRSKNESADRFLKEESATQSLSKLKGWIIELTADKPTQAESQDAKANSSATRGSNEKQSESVYRIRIRRN
jgi:hypothetical protein